jgi:hypothetical protein
MTRNDLYSPLGIAQASRRHRRLDPSWTDTIDTDTLLRILQRRCFGESNHAMFTGSVGGIASVTD